MTESKIKNLLVFGFSLLGFLSLISTGYLLIYESEILPFWFVVIFSVGNIGFIAICVFLSLTCLSNQILFSPKRYHHVIAWILIIASFAINASVHQFYGFTRINEIFSGHWEGIVIANTLVIWLGIFIASVLAILFFRGKERIAQFYALLLAFIILIPTCNCPNPFNTFWNSILGASPLMFVPTSFNILCGVAVTLGIKPMLCILLIIISNIATLGLGVGHIMGIIW
jgi:hypothetical protein